MLLSKEADKTPPDLKHPQTEIFVKSDKYKFLKNMKALHPNTGIL